MHASPSDSIKAQTKSSHAYQRCNIFRYRHILFSIVGRCKFSKTLFSIGPEHFHGALEQLKEIGVDYAQGYRIEKTSPLANLRI
jgi:hypothetical protein